MNDTFRCSVCGGQLEYTDKKNGIVKCINCGNVSTIDFKLSIDDSDIKDLANSTPVFIKQSGADLLKEQNNKRKKNIMRFVWIYSTVILLLIMFSASYGISVLCTKSVEIRAQDLILLCAFIFITFILSLIVLKIRVKTLSGSKVFAGIVFPMYIFILAAAIYYIIASNIIKF